MSQQGVSDRESIKPGLVLVLTRSRQDGSRDLLDSFLRSGKVRGLDFSVEYKRVSEGVFPQIVVSPENPCGLPVGRVEGRYCDDFFRMYIEPDGKDPGMKVVVGKHQTRSDQELMKYLGREGLVLGKDYFISEAERGRGNTLPAIHLLPGNIFSAKPIVAEGLSACKKLLAGHYPKAHSRETA